MLSAFGGRLLGGGGSSNAGERVIASSSSSSGSSSRRGLHTSQVELLISSTSSNSLSEPLDCPRNSLLGDDNTAQAHWHQQQHPGLSHNKQEEFVNANGVIFTLSKSCNLNHLHQQQKQQQQHHQETTQYSLGNVMQRDDLLAQQQQQQPQPQTPPPLPKGLNGRQLNSSSASVSSSNNQPKPLHRHLQYRPIHQQLQRIYGNKLQEFEQLNRQQKFLTQGLDNREQPAAMIKQQEHVYASNGLLNQSKRRNQYHHQQQQQEHQRMPTGDAHGLLYQHTEQTYDSLNVNEPAPPPPLPASSQNRSHHYQQKQQQVTRKQQPKHHQDFYDFNPQPQQQQQSLASRPIRAIPEERLSRDQNNNIVMPKMTLNSGDDDDEDDEEQVYAEDDNEDDDEEDDEDELANEEEEENGFLLQNDALRIAKQSSRVLISSRKKQMESLHYATATAAALLNVTASAAAAFAVSDKHLVSQRQQQQQKQKQQQPLPPPQQSRVGAPNRRLMQPIPGPMVTGSGPRDPRVYMDTTYQNHGGVRGQHTDQYQQLYGEHGRGGINYQDQVPRHIKQQARQNNHHHHQQHQLGQPNRMPPAQYRPSMRMIQKAPAQPNASQLLSMDGHQNNGALYNLIQQQQQSNQAGLVGVGNQHNQHIQQVPAAMVRPIQAAHGTPQQIIQRPVVGGPLTNQQLELLRRYKHQMQAQKAAKEASSIAIYGGGIYTNNQMQNRSNQNNNKPVLDALALASNGIPALAILQPRAAKPGNAELMARLAANHKQQQQQQLLAAAATSLNPRLLMLAPGQIQNGPLGKVQYEQQQQQQQQVTYGLLVAAAAAAAARGSKQQQQQQQPVYGASRVPVKGQPEQQVAAVARSHYQIGRAIASSNSSDASGHSNFPLILNGKVAKPKLSLLDKISHIDLTIFWWVLLTICVLFITAVVAITRYLI